jgi:hypothetical protein
MFMILENKDGYIYFPTVSDGHNSDAMKILFLAGKFHYFINSISLTRCSFFVILFNHYP